ncbi:Hypothetical protein CINCED_3A003409 [Cinara cedri]|nr:Hypothetical protein CINCED_3A003409 [Cinara cedri]
MINELRKSQLYAKPKIVSKMFSCNGNQNKPSPALELGIKTHQKQMEANNILKMNIQPDKNIPKTVYYKRLCHKFAMENKINEFKNKNSKENEKDKIITDKKYPTLELETETHAKRTTEDNNSCKPEDQIENKDLIVNEFTDKNIMNTVHCKPLYQKFDEENETIEFENKKPEEIDKIITDKKNEDLNLKLNVYQKQIEVINNSGKPENLNIPKTVFCQRPCQKFDNENKSIEFENKNIEEIDEIIANKKTSAVNLEIETHSKRTTEDINNSSKSEDQIENKDLTVVFTDKNIMNTVYCKPLYQKFDKENEPIEFENKKPEEIDKIITDKKNEDINLRLNVYQKQIEVINNSDKPENQNEINDDFTTNIQPNKNISKTVCYQRLCQKLDKVNETIKFENKKPEEIDKIITNKITEDKNELNNINKSIHQYNPMSDKSSETSLNTSESNQLPVHFEVEHGALFRNSRKRKVIMLSTSDDNKPITRKGRRVKLITIKNNYSQPIPSFNGAKKTEIDFSKNSIHIEKVVESSSLFYIPQVKKRRTMNFGDCNS